MSEQLKNTDKIKLTAAYELRQLVYGISALAEVLTHFKFTEAMICRFKNCIHWFVKCENQGTWAVRVLIPSLLTSTCDSRGSRRP